MCDRNQTTASTLPHDPMFDREVEKMRAAAHVAQCDHGIGACKAEPSYEPTVQRELRQRRAMLQERVRRLNSRIDTIDLVLDVFVD